MSATTIRSPQLFIERISNEQKSGEYDRAIDNILKNLDWLFACREWESARRVVQEFPPEYLEQDPRLQYVQGYIFARGENLSVAKELLNKAKFSQTAGQPDMAIRCNLELGYAYLRTEDFQTAFHYLNEAEDLLQKSENKQLQAKLRLRLAELYPDRGELNRSIGYAERAYQGFREIDEIYGQFEALWLLALIHRQMGAFHQAAARLEMAKALQLAGNLKPQTNVKVLNADAHLSWYCGNLSAAVVQAEQLKAFADANGMEKQGIYARALLGNLYRDTGDSHRAQAMYNETRQLATRRHHYDL